MNDARSRSIKKTTLITWIEKLPPRYFIACDCAYSISDHLIGLCDGADHFSEKYDAFNFFIVATYSHCDGFWDNGKKWQILKAPFSMRLNYTSVFGLLLDYTTTV